jgi:predicted esterase
MPEQLIVSATTHGRVLVEVPSVARALTSMPMLVGFHGYGENAERHLQELLAIPGTASWVRVAVQALHPFYNTKTGEVVANWMTKEDRELAIADNAAYVRSVVGRVRQQTGAGGPLVYAGFSQGAAMAYRAAALAGHAAAGIVAVGGDLPPELGGGASPLAPAPSNLRVLVARGDGDPWYTRDKLATDLAALAHLGVPALPLTYAGGHEWTAELRAAVGRFLHDLS